MSSLGIFKGLNEEFYWGLYGIQIQTIYTGQNKTVKEFVDFYSWFLSQF
jgi:hypothetical protein